MYTQFALGTVILGLWSAAVSGQGATGPSCPGVAPALYPFQTFQSFWAVKVAGGLKSPRDLVSDSSGRLLIVESGLGITQHIIDQSSGCISSSATLVSMSSLNHGIYLSPDGTTLYASDVNSIYAWAYNAADGTVGSTYATVVKGMAGSDHNTRSLIMTPTHPNLLVISHGSDANLDLAAIDPSLGRSVIKVFDITAVPDGGYNWLTDGYLIGSGLRNDVGLVFDGNSMLWSVENSADDLTRTVNGVSTDVHTNNPAEELNYIGDVSVSNTNFFGYPECFTVGDPTEFNTAIDTAAASFVPGSQFVLAPNDTVNDATCTQVSRAPSLIFQAHSAPLGCKFDPSFSTMFVTLHGSWDRVPATGYKMVTVPFTRDSTGAYVPSNGMTGYTDAFYSPNEGNCSSSACTRPVGLVWDPSGRLYMTSDSSGELFLIGPTGL